MYGGTSPSGGEKPLLVPLELASKSLTRIMNRCEAFGCLHRILGNFGSKARDKIQNRVRKDRKGIKKGWGLFTRRSPDSVLFSCHI